MRLLSAILALAISLNAFGQIGSGFQENAEDSNRSRISEYFFSRTGREILKPVHLIGSVEKPGIYHVPEGTSVMTILTLAGGPKDLADIENIQLTHANGKQEVTELQDMVKSPKSYALLEGDTVYIPVQTGWLNTARSNNFTLLVSIATLFLTAYVVADDR